MSSHFSSSKWDMESVRAGIEGETHERLFVLGMFNGRSPIKVTNLPLMSPVMKGAGLDPIRRGVISIEDMEEDEDD